MWCDFHCPPHPQTPWSHQYLLVVGILSSHRWICNWNHLSDHHHPDSYLKEVGHCNRNQITDMDKIYLIENSVNGCRNRVSGYFKTYDDAYEALKKCSDWWMPNGSGQIYEVSFGLNGERKMVYDSYTQGLAK